MSDVYDCKLALRACPFCGGEAFLTQIHVGDRWQVMAAFADCGGNYGSGSGKELALLAELTAKNWNKRETTR